MKNIKLLIVYIFVLSISCKLQLPEYRNGYSFEQIFEEEAVLTVDANIIDPYGSVYSEKEKCLIYYDEYSIIYLIDIAQMNIVSEINWEDNSDSRPSNASIDLYVSDQMLYVLSRNDCIVYSIKDIENPEYITSLPKKNNFSYDELYYYTVFTNEDRIFITNRDYCIDVFDKDSFEYIGQYVFEFSYIRSRVIANNKYLYIFISDTYDINEISSMYIYEITDNGLNFIEEVNTQYLSIDDENCCFYDDILICDYTLSPDQTKYNFTILKFDENEKYKFLQNFECTDDLENELSEKLNFFNRLDMDFDFSEILIGNVFIYDFREENVPYWIGNIEHELEDRYIKMKMQANEYLILFEYSRADLDQMKIIKYKFK